MKRRDFLKSISIGGVAVSVGRALTLKATVERLWAGTEAVELIDSDRSDIWTATEPESKVSWGRTACRHTHKHREC